MLRFRRLFVGANLAVLFLVDVSVGAGEDALRGELAPLSSLVGKWSGSGCVTERGGEKQCFEGSELVEARIGGHVLLIEGRHFAADGPQKGELVHHAMALVSWDTEESRVRFDSFVKGRGRSDFTGRFEEGRFVWGRDQGVGHRFRYTIDLSNKDVWYEIGEYSVDGKKWTQFFEMRLTRKP